MYKKVVGESVKFYQFYEWVQNELGKAKYNQDENEEFIDTD